MINLNPFKKLTSWLPAFVLALALLSTTAQAQIIHSIDSGSISTPSLQAAGIDIDNDGALDAYFGARVYDTTISGARNFITLGFIALNPGNALASDVYINSGQVIPRISKLSYGDTVGPHLQYRTDSAPRIQYLISIDSLYDTANNTPVQAYIGYFRDTSFHFVGIRFTDGNDTYYGWLRVRLSVFTAKKLTVTFYDYAYQSTPNTPILAGDTGAGVIVSFADSARAILAADVADNGNGLDLSVSFNKANNESTLSAYRLIAVPDSLAAGFNLATAQNVPSAWYLNKLKTGANITTTFQAASRDFQGNAIQNGKAYRIFILNVADGNIANTNTLSGPSNLVILNVVVNPVSADAATGVIATDVANNQNGTDLQVAFTKAPQENTVASYKIIVVKASAAGAFNLSAANGLAAGNSTTVTPTGADITQILTATSKDADGATIAENIAYKVFVLSVADGSNANVNTLSAPSDTVTLSHPVGINNVQPLENVNIYSNHNVVYIHFADAANTSGTLTIFNTAGQQVYANKISGDQAIVLDNVAGLYMVTLVQNGKVLNKQLFINNK